MLERDKQIPELYDLKHRKDDIKNKGADYRNNLVSNTTSGYLINNDNLNDFMTWIQSMCSMIIQTNLVLRNFWNYDVDKYYDNHNN
jgi:hypothetical protein